MACAVYAAWKVVRESGMVESKKRKLEENDLARVETANSKKKIIKWRNYHPQDKSLIHISKDEQNENQEPNEAGDGGRKGAVLLPPPSTPASQQENFIKKELRKYQDEELNILPRNNNWDVKKLLEPKLEKLKKRTQKAIVDFLREKLANMSEGSDEEEEGEE